MRNDAGTVGTTDCRNKKSIRASGCSRGTSGSGLSNGIHTISDETMISAWTPKCSKPLLQRRRSTTTGMCVTMMTKLKMSVAGINRDM